MILEAFVHTIEALLVHQQIAFMSVTRIHWLLHPIAAG